MPKKILLVVEGGVLQDVLMDEQIADVEVWVIENDSHRVFEDGRPDDAARIDRLLAEAAEEFSEYDEEEEDDSND